MIKLGQVELFKKSSDGGVNSGVTGYWLIEWKKGFSICFLQFKPNNRENFHSHAFNAYTWWLNGLVVEKFPDSKARAWKPSLKPKYTPRENMHKIELFSDKPVWAFSIRGPWQDTWHELTPEGKKVCLTNGRKPL